MEEKAFEPLQNSFNPNRAKQVNSTELDIEEIGQIDYILKKNENEKNIKNHQKSASYLEQNDIFESNDRSKQNRFSDIYQSIEQKRNQISSPRGEEEDGTNFLSFNRHDPSPKKFSPDISTNSKPKKRKSIEANGETSISNANNHYIMNNIISIQLHQSVLIPPFYSFNYGNIEVKFPYEHPYEAQKLLISSSLKAFIKGDNALLESPTGTGKSLALLSSSLSYLEQNPQVTRIFYTSRTHIQLQQLVGELKKLPYFPRFSILASRRHLCIVDEVVKSASPDYECRKVCEENGCIYNQNANALMNPNTNKSKNDIEDIAGKTRINMAAVPFEFTNQGPKPKFDLDDLKEYGRTFKICPYILSRNIYQNAQLVFCPYNYILTPNDDKSLLLDSIKNSSIVIFDEGHNIESTARDDSSISISYKLATEVLKAAQNAPITCSYKQLLDQVKIISTDIINFIDSKREKYNELYVNTNAKAPKYLPGNYVKSVFILTNQNNIQLSKVGSQMYNWIQNVMNKDSSDKKLYVNDHLISFFTTCCDVFGMLTQASLESFRVAFIPDEGGRKDKDEFRLLCMRPALLFEKIKKNARSIIIASGTLSPFESFASELETSFGIRVSAPHVVDPSQVLTLSIKSYNNCPITSKFSVLQSRNQEIYSNLSTIILKTIKEVPGGALLFTPSYYTKDSIIKRWRISKAYDLISQIKPIVEERSDLPAQKIIREFTSYPRGGLLVGVCRGKISEGLDFSDDLARIVYVFGIPYPGFKDAEVELKMKYNDIRHSYDKDYLAGNDWYNGQAFRALFQSVGRCVRHMNDYGAIVFLDERIEQNMEKLPKWLMNNFYKTTTVDQAESLLSKFYADMKQRFPHSKSSSLLGKREEKTVNYEEKPIIPSYSSSNTITVRSNSGDAEDVQPVSFKSASELYRSDYVKYEYNKKDVCNHVDKSIENIYDDDYNDDNSLVTNMFCSSCGSPILRIKDLNQVDFKDISTPEFFQILNLKDKELKVMSIMENDLQNDFTRATKITKWSTRDSCILTRRECQKCGTPIAAYVVSSRSNGLKKGEFLCRKEMLSMKFEGKIMTLSEIASVG
ncbi:hypothetical protein M9Y10_041475 [Tritrichomonas musculus]|uniref:Helicase ATP-binding domain-containing protein n=1 Tax=Tritrichomonas musculus TaxID=1915356 RepID=A0ABR2K4G2_9EUKA